MAAVCSLLLTVAAGWISAYAQGPWSLVRAAPSFDRSSLADPRHVQKIRSGGTLSGGKGEWGITGNVDYDFQVPAAGWYELSILGNAAETEFLFDPLGNESGSGASFYGGTGQVGTEERVGSAWLKAGAHTLRIQRYFWTGFPRIEGFVLRAADNSIAKSIRISLGDAVPVYRTGECPQLQVEAGGRTPAKLTVWTRDGADRIRRTDTLDFPAGGTPARRTLPLLCAEEGQHTLRFGNGQGEISWRDVRPLAYQVVDTRKPPHDAVALRKIPLQEIDLAARAPDFSGGETRVTASPAGSYRESSEAGFTRFQRAPQPARALMPEPGWFAYRLEGITPQQPHLVEVDYPDDRLRSFAIALRESAPLSYPVAGGVDSGGEFSTTGNMLTESLLFWPRAVAPRVTVLNTHDGRRAAAARIRVYRLEGTLPPLVPEGTAGRHFVNWYEEGSNFLSMYGAPDGWTGGPAAIALQRWAETVRSTGGTVLAPTVLVYGFALYPSAYNRAFSKPGNDLLRGMLLAAEKNGLKVLPELHPRADELDTATDAAAPRPHLLVSKEGRTRYYEADGKTRVHPPLYNPLYPPNQDWYVGMIGELADTYRDSPALLGVNLRLMQWANPALNNFHSLDWGYDDFTVSLFGRETGRDVPLGNPADPSRFAARYRWLMANAREQWIDWRCRKIAALYVRIRDRVQAARPDLKVYSSVFQWEGEGDSAETLRGAGIDPMLLNGIAGVELINALHAYGRKEPDPIVSQSARDGLLDPRRLALLSGTGAPGRFLSGAKYIEITEAVAPPQQLGFPANTKLTWTSATANPAGRHHLERFAVELAETDATVLGDGGNAYSVGQPVLREFLSEYLRLPAEPFSARADAWDPAAVRERSTRSGLYFYAVNRERYPITLDVTLSEPAGVKRISGGESVALAGDRLRIELKPYQLIAYRTATMVRILKVETRVPAAQRELVARQVRWLGDLARVQDGKWFGSLDEAERRTLENAASEAATAMAAGALWRARTLLERREMLAIYAKLNRMPPQLRDAMAE